MGGLSEKQGGDISNDEAGFFNLPANLRMMSQFGAKARELTEKLGGLRGRQNRAERKQVEEELKTAQGASRRAFLKVFGLGSAAAVAGIVTGVGVKALGEDATKPEQNLPVAEGGTNKFEHVEIEKLLTEEETRQLYDQGFAKVMDGVPDEPAEVMDFPTGELSSLKKFRNKYCSWAYLGPDGYFSLEDGYENAAWMSVVMPGNPMYDRLQGVVSVDPDRKDVNMLNIQPVPMTKTWAGIFLTHELGHLRDMVTGREKKNPSIQEFLKGEVLAYFSEIVLADRITKGRYSQEMKTIIDEVGLKDADSVVAFFRSSVSQSEVVSKRLDALFDESEPKSNRERGMRDGFYTISMCFAIIGRERIPEDQKIQKFIEFMRKLMDK